MEGIPTSTGVAHCPPHNLTASSMNSKTNISQNLGFLQANHPGGDDFFRFSSLDQLIHLLNCSDDLGFLAHPARQDDCELFNIDKFIDQNNDGGGFANDNSSPASLRVRTNPNPEIGGMTSRANFRDADLSSLDDDCEVSEASERDLDQEKIIVKMPELKVFLQNLISQVMQKQEEMHRQLINIIEKREKERISLEETWKKQETEREKVYEEERKQEMLRSLALISFIRKSFHSPESSNRGDKCARTQNRNCRKKRSNNKRWAKTELQALITFRMAVEQKFLVKGGKSSGWKEVAAGLSKIGYNRSPEKCREKWENINKYYRRTMESGKKRERSLPYFEELDLLYKRGLLSHGNASP